MTSLEPKKSILDMLKVKPIDHSQKTFEITIKHQPGVAKEVIVDKTKSGYDYAGLLEKINGAKLLKVKSIPVLEAQRQEAQRQEAQRQEAQRQEAQRQEQKEPPKKAKKIKLPPTQIPAGFVFEEEEDDKVVDDDVDVEEAVENPIEKVEPPKEKEKKKRKPKEVAAGVIDDVANRVPRKEFPINIMVSNYYMNNREKFINFINSLFEPYRRELDENKESISCDTIGKTSSDFSLLTHQKIVRDYMNLYTPYRGLLLYHGLGSGKTCTSIAIAEGMKDSKRIIVLTPASLRRNYMEELKKCGDYLFKKNQYWEWFSSPSNFEQISQILSLPLAYIKKNKGAWFVNVKKPSNYDSLNSKDKVSLDEQLDEMIRNKYTFINYNGLRTTKLKELTLGFTKNLFDDAVIVVDEAHNLISRIVNKIKKEKVIPENDKGEKEMSPKFLSSKLYEYLLSANNARIILLTGTPVINYPNEFGILFNILRGYIKTWKIKLDVKTSKKINKESLTEMLITEKSMDYLDYSPSSKVLTITRNPFGFRSKLARDLTYQGVTNHTKDDAGNFLLNTDVISDEEFQRKIIKALNKNEIDVPAGGIKITNQKALPDNLDYFKRQYINTDTNVLTNVDSLKRRIVGLSSYFKSAQESLLPRYDKNNSEYYHVLKLPMSDFQFKIYESARKEERKTEKKSKKNVALTDDIFEEKSSTYRIFSRLFCNFVMPDRPKPIKLKKTKTGQEEAVDDIAKEASKLETTKDMGDDREGEIEGDEILDEIGGVTYKEELDRAIVNIRENPSDFLTSEALKTYSPKFLAILENINDEEHVGLHLIYSQFRTLEGIGVFSLVLENNGFARFRIKRSQTGVWELDIHEADEGKQMYALYTGTETAEEKEIIRNIYNGDWEYIPTNIREQLQDKANNNNLGEIIKVLMITSSGSEGINLRNTRYVHIMEPYWHPVRSEQVIGRARRICSHKNLPEELQTVEVFVYLMVFSAEQLKSDDTIELRQYDLGKRPPFLPVTSDQLLYELSEIKSELSNQLADVIKESSFDCYLHSGKKCVNFGSPSNDKYTYVPDFTEQQNDATTAMNRQEVKLKGTEITIKGVKYISTQDPNNKQLLNIYDEASFVNAQQNPDQPPVLVGVVEIDSAGKKKFRPVK
jgi:hypothetical protein